MKVAVALLALLAAASAVPQLSFANLFRQPLKVEHAQPSPRIIGGQEAEPNSLPYQVLLQLRGLLSSWQCGGALISPSYILTAAHCLDGANIIQVILGAHNRLEDEPTQVKITTTQYKIHEAWDVNTISNDIGIAILPEPVELTDAIQTVALPSDDSDDFSGAQALASGWGITNDTAEDYSDVLNEVESTVITNNACQAIYGGAIQDFMLCTSPGIGIGICTGDSGGPLVSNGVHIGVSSFTSVSCGPYPSGFTRTSSYIDWLKTNTDA